MIKKMKMIKKNEINWKKINCKINSIAERAVG